MDENNLPGGNDHNAVIKDVDAVFNRIPNDSTIYKFSKDDDVSKPKGGHLQGIQASRDRSVYVLSGSSDEIAYLLTVDRATLKVKKRTNITRDDFPTLRHAGGFQVIGNFLVVGLENDEKEGSIVSLYEIMEDSSLKFKRNLAEREAMAKGRGTAGAVGIVKLPGGEFLMVVGAWHCNTVDIYKSNGESLGEEACTFELKATWKDGDDDANKSGWIDKHWGKYQSLNLVLGSDDNVYMIAFNRGSNGNFVDLFFVDKEVDANTVNSCFVKRTNKAVICRDGVSFRLGAGIWVRDGGNISLLASERNLDQRTTINLF